MVTLTRFPKFLAVFGAITLLLSIISPIITVSYRPISYLEYGTYEGVLVNCYDAIDVRIKARNDNVISAYFLNSTNGLRAIEEGSLVNVSTLHQSLNRTLVFERWAIPHPGWYAILVTPSNNETIQSISIEFVQQIPNPRVLLAGGILIIVSVLWVFWGKRNAK
jgi:hypothetical protein